jgi:hypothetical protein
LDIGHLAKVDPGAGLVGQAGVFVALAVIGNLPPQRGGRLRGPRPGESTTPAVTTTTMIATTQAARGDRVGHINGKLFGPTSLAAAQPYTTAAGNELRGAGGRNPSTSVVGLT